MILNLSPPPPLPVQATNARQTFAARNMRRPALNKTNSSVKVIGTARRELNPCAREPKARTGRFLREKLMSDRGHFSSYEVHKERRTGKIRGAFSRMRRALDAWMLARAPASPAQGLHHHGPRYFHFPYFCTMYGIEKLGLVDQN